MWNETNQERANRLSVDSASKSAVSEWAVSEWAEWPDADVDVDDEAFAAAIARGRELEAAA